MSDHKGPPASPLPLPSPPPPWPRSASWQAATWARNAAPGRGCSGTGHRTGRTSSWPGPDSSALSRSPCLPAGWQSARPTTLSRGRSPALIPPRTWSAPGSATSNGTSVPYCGRPPLMGSSPSSSPIPRSSSAQSPPRPPITAHHEYPQAARRMADPQPTCTSSRSVVGALKLVQGNGQFRTRADAASVRRAAVRSN
jgi:hypothetical protein